MTGKERRQNQINYCYLKQWHSGSEVWSGRDWRPCLWRSVLQQACRWSGLGVLSETENILHAHTFAQWVQPSVGVRDKGTSQDHHLKKNYWREDNQEYLSRQVLHALIRRPLPTPVGLKTKCKWSYNQNLPGYESQLWPATHLRSRSWRPVVKWNQKPFSLNLAADRKLFQLLIKRMLDPQLKQ